MPAGIFRHYSRLRVSIDLFYFYNNLGYVLLFIKEFSGSYTDIWPWPMIPAATSGFIIYYLSSLDTVRKRLSEGLIQSGVMGLVAAVAYLIASLEAAAS